MESIVISWASIRVSSGKDERAKTVSVSDREGGQQ
jgi:hypothetical protein